MLIKSLPESERPEERALKNGIRSLSDAELIALLIRTGRQSKSSIGIAEEILASCEEGLYTLGSIDTSDLTKIDGIGSSKACTVVAAIELGKRIAMSRQPERKSVEDSDVIADMFMEDLRYEKKEHFKSVSLNTKGEVLSVDSISVGELSRTLVHPREVFVNAIRRNAYGVIFVHNHPSGDPSPSQEDIMTTERLINGGDILGIKVLDHIIIGDGYFSSMRALDIIK